VRIKPPCKRYTNFDKGGLEESFVVTESANTHMSKHNVVIEGINPNLAHDVKTSMKKASDNNMSLGEDMQATNTCSKRKHNGAKPKEIPSDKRQYIRRSELNKSSTPTKVSRDLPVKISANTCINSIDFETRARDESSANRENQLCICAKKLVQ